MKTFPSNWVFSSQNTAAVFQNHIIRHLPIGSLDLKLDVEILTEKINELSKAFAALERNLDKCKR